MKSKIKFIRVLGSGENYNTNIMFKDWCVYKNKTDFNYQNVIIRSQKINKA